MAGVGKSVCKQSWKPVSARDAFQSNGYAQGLALFRFMQFGTDTFLFYKHPPGLDQGG